MSNSVDFATITGQLIEDGVEDGTVDDDAFGIDIYFQGANWSPDWDIVSYHGRV